jgi:hypothetical protein
VRPLILLPRACRAVRAQRADHGTAHQRMMHGTIML